LQAFLAQAILWPIKWFSVESSFSVTSAKVVNGNVYIALVKGSSYIVSRLRGDSMETLTRVLEEFGVAIISLSPHMLDMPCISAGASSRLTCRPSCLSTHPASCSNLLPSHSSANVCNSRLHRATCSHLGRLSVFLERSSVFSLCCQPAP